MIPLPTAAEMRKLDEDTITKLGIPGGVLMESAGRGVVAVLHELHRARRIDLFGSQVVVVAGPGNNGGDGMVIARYLHQQGVTCELWIVAEPSRVRGDSLLHLTAAQAAVVRMTFCNGSTTTLCTRLASLRREDLIVDALLGTGLQRSVQGNLASVINSINDSRASTISVDLPSGLDADRGLPEDAGEPAVIVRADYTVTLGFPKLGLASAPGFVFAGEVFVADIGIPASLCASSRVSAQLLDARVLERLTAPRSPLGHKGSHGHLLLLAGSSGKLGAALLATQAALAVGVGLCTLALPETALDGSLGSRCPEAMTVTYPLSASSLADILQPAVVGKSALAIGPGLAPTESIRSLIVSLLSRCQQPLVLDAEALNLLVGHEESLGQRARAGHTTVITPHPGEAGRLLGVSSAVIQADRVTAARRLAERTCAVVLLKGARTLIVEPPTDATQLKPPRLAVVPTGNVAMGSGGMGDVLTGMIGALLTSGWPAFEATCAAAYWHGLAGDLAARRRAPGSIVLATEVLEQLDEARKRAGSHASEQPPWPILPLAWTQVGS